MRQDSRYKPGKIVADDTAQNLATSLSSDHRLLVRIDGPKDEVEAIIKGISESKRLLSILKLKRAYGNTGLKRRKM